MTDGADFNPWQHSQIELYQVTYLVVCQPFFREQPNLGKGSKQKKYLAREHVRSSSDPPPPQAVRDALFDH